MKLKNKIAVITGAGGDIGRAISILFSVEGAKILCADFNRQTAEETVTQIITLGGKADFTKCDVRDSVSAQNVIDRVINEFGQIDILVNSAVYFPPAGKIIEIDEKHWHRAVSTNIGGAFLMSKYAIPHMISSGGGVIIHLASQMGRVGSKGQATYCATKGALLTMAKAMALDHASDGIRVNTLSPGGVASSSLVKKWGSMENAEREWGRAMHPIGRLARVEEIARAALFLASDDSSFMTGADLLVDGGYCAG